ncbi:TPA: PcfJ domain-containing protein [Citrobacter koseri]
MKLYLLKNKVVISFSSVIPLAIKVYVRDGQVLSDIHHESNVQRGEIDCGIPLFNVEIVGKDCVEHLINMLNIDIDSNIERILCYNDAQIELFNAISTSKSLSELYFDCSNLAWGIVLDNYYGHNAHAVEYLSRMKRKILLSIIAGTPPQERLVTLLKKTILLHGRKYEFGLLSKILKDEEVIEDYRHSKTVTIQELYMASRYKLFSGSVLLNHLCQSKKDFFREYKVGMAYLERLVRDSIRIGENIGMKKSRDIVLSCSNIDQVQQLHDRWTQRLRDTTKYIKDDIWFEEPSINVWDGIEFIASVNGLIREGKEMEHCLASYKMKALNGESYIYKYSSVGRKRLTIELGLSNGIYILKQAKGYRNSEPGNVEINYIHTWLDNENKDLKARVKEYEQHFLKTLSA